MEIICSSRYFTICLICLHNSELYSFFKAYNKSLLQYFFTKKNMVDNEKIPNKLVLSNDGNKINIITGVPYKISNREHYIEDLGDGSHPYLSPYNHPPGHTLYSRQLWVLKETSYPRGYKMAANGNYMESREVSHKAKLYLSSFDNPPEDSGYSQQ